MSSLPSRFCACALVSVVLTAGVPVGAAPPHARIIGHQMPLAAPRVTQVPALHYSRPAFNYHPLTLQSAPIRALPLVVPRAPILVLPAFAPRFALATLLAAPAIDPCAGARSPVLLATLPTAPFTPVTCDHDGALRDSRSWPPSLAPGHNRNALYGRAYSPRADIGQ